MNQNVKTNEVFALKDLISYEEGSIANMDVASNDSMKYVLMAFDEGTGLAPHRAKITSSLPVSASALKKTDFTA